MFSVLSLIRIINIDNVLMSLFCTFVILAIAEQSEAYPRLTLAKIIIAEQSQAYPPINSS